MPTGPILYFIEGAVPTNEEFELALPLMNKGPFFEWVSLQTLDFNKEMLNASAVAGMVPEAYREKYPLAEADNDEVKADVVIENVPVPDNQ